MAAEQGRGCRARSRRRRPSGRCGGRRRTGAARSPGTGSSRRGRGGRGGSTAGSSVFGLRRRSAGRRARRAGRATRRRRAAGPFPAAIPGPRARWAWSASTWTRSWWRSPPGGASKPDGGRARASSAIAVRHSALLGCGGRRRVLPRFRGTAELALLGELLGADGRDRLARRLERLDQQRAVRRRELRVDLERPVLVVPRPAQEGVAVDLAGLLRADSPRRTDDPLELGRRRVRGELDQVGLALGVGDPGHRADLGVAQLSRREQRRDRGRASRAPARRGRARAPSAGSASSATRPTPTSSGSRCRPILRGGRTRGPARASARGRP